MNEWLIVVYNHSRSEIRGVYGAREQQNAVLYRNTGQQTTVDVGAAPISSFLASVSNENCIDASVTTDSYTPVMDVQPLDILEIHVLRNNDFIPVFLGRVRIPMQRRRDGRSYTMQVTGISQEFDKCPTGQNFEVAAGTELITALQAVLERTVLPAGIVFASFAPVGVQLSRATNFGSVDLGQVLDALVAFGLQAGKELIYGVNAWGQLFFKEKVVTTLNETETANLTVPSGGVITWTNPDGIEYCNGVVWHLGAGQYAQDRLFVRNRISPFIPDDWTYSNATLDPITHTIKKPAPYHDALKVLTPPQEVIFPTKGVDYEESVGTAISSFANSASQDPFFNYNRLNDNDPLSYAVWRMAASGSNRDLQVQMVATPNPIDPEIAVGVRINCKRLSGTAALNNQVVEIIGVGMAYDSTVIDSDDLQFASQGPQVIKRGGAFEDLDITVLFGDRLRNYRSDFVNPRILGANGFITLRIQGTSSGTVDIAIESFQLLTIDTQLLDGLTEQEVSIPSLQNFALTFSDRTIPEVSQVQLTTLESDIVAGDVSEVRYSLDAVGLQQAFIVGGVVPYESLRLLKHQRRVAQAGDLNVTRLKL